MNKHGSSRNTSRRLIAEHKDITLSRTQTATHEQESQKYFQNILGDLSLFSPGQTNHVQKRDRVREERAELSVPEKIRIPASLSEFGQQLRNRITQQSLHTFSNEDKETLATVMMAELSLIWQDLRGLPADPSLTLEENRQLRSGIYGEVLCICENLYLHYLHLLEMLGKRAVFSHQVNCSRLASHMAMDLSSLLNAHSIQRRVATGVKAMRGAVNLRDEEQGALQTHIFPHMLDNWPQIPSKKHVANRQQKTTLEKDLTEIQNKIGELDREHVYDLIPYQLEQKTTVDTSCGTASVPIEAKDRCLFQNHVTRLKGCNSVPDLQRGALLEAALPARPLSPLVLLSTSPWLEKHINAAEDLRRLLQETDKSMSADSEADIPPLIRASASHGPSKLKELTVMLRRLEKEEERRKQRPPEVPRPQHPQAAVESVNVSVLGIARIAAARVSDRVLSETVNISMYPPVYNDLTGEMESSSVTWLDRNLFDGTEIKEVYKELSKGFPDNYLNFDEDPVIEPALNEAQLLHGLKRNHEKKLMNSSLQMPNPYGISHRKRMELAGDHEKPVDETSRGYVAWHRWWKSNLSLDDYLSYISKQESDYLSVVFHLYDSDDSEDEKMQGGMHELQNEKIRKQREKIDALRTQKQAYQSGLWNVNAVLMGGLWKEPETVPDEVEEANKDIQHVGTAEDYSVPLAAPVEGEQVQARLERIWMMLCLPETQRLDMAIKYSSQAHRDKLEEATAAWEQAAQLIQQRELALSRLEQFESMASDPSRFFQHGYLGTSAARMKEANHREKLESQIAALDKVLSKTIHHISSSFSDTVTYKGRPYREKMRWDRTEMLYWLQQERRLQVLEKLVQGREGLPARLPPLNTSYRLNSGTPSALEDHPSLASEETLQSNELLSSLGLCVSCTSIPSVKK